MAVAVVGIDVGGLTSCIAVAKGGGIEVIDNEYSDRMTPTCVAFADRRRMMGTAAKLQHATNISNTYVNFLPLIGKMYTDIAVKRMAQQFPHSLQAGSDGRVNIPVKFNDHIYNVLPEQLLAMHLTKLKEIAERSLSSKVVDVVINVPTYYTDRGRRAMLDASRIAGLNCVKLVNDLTAIGIAYGLYNKDLPAADQPPRHVAFVSVGYTSTQVSICAFNNNKMKVLATAWDAELGGRSFDNVIFTRFASEFRERHNLKLTDTPKAVVRLLHESEKIKKQMSATAQEIPISIECMIGDRDFTSKLKRSVFEELSADLISRLEKVMQRCIQRSKLETSAIDLVELVGGSCRIPAVKSMVASVFYQEGRTTLNADEVVARGCALQAAMCSPASRVREFAVVDACPYSITLHWDNEDGGRDPEISTEHNDALTVSNKETSIEVFPELHAIPCSRRMFFDRRKPFTLEARYTHPDKVPNNDSVIGSFKVNGVPNLEEPSKIRVKLRVNPHGIFSLSQAEIAEEYEKEVETEVNDEQPVTNGKTEKPMEVESPDNGDVSDQAALNEAASPSAAKLPTKKLIKKKFMRYKDIPVEEFITQLNSKQLNEFCELEGKLIEQDLMEQHRANAKNAVEEYLYDMRNKLENQLSKFVTTEERTSLGNLLDETEDWLYGEGEDQLRQVYTDRLSSIRQLGDKIVFRYTEHQNRKSTIDNCELAIMGVREVLNSVALGQDTYNHLTAEQLNRLTTSVDTFEVWFRERLEMQKSKKLFEDPAFTIADILSQKQVLESTCNPIIATKKPAPAAPPPPANDATAKVDPQSDRASQNPSEEDKKNQTVNNAEKSECMEVD